VCPGRRQPRGVAIQGDEPYYREGDRLKRQEHKEALGAFLRVIEKRGDDAPESHLEAGLLYQQYFKDPIAAIYHFRRYLDLQPNARQADLVRQRIDAAMRDFAADAAGATAREPGGPARTDEPDRTSCQRENLQLKESWRDAIRRLPEATGSHWSRSAWRCAPLRLRMPPPPCFSVSARPVPRPRGAAGSAVRTPPAPRATPAPAAASGRTHVVAAGESLLQDRATPINGNGTRWPEILEANRDRLKNEGAVRVGMELRIP